MNKIHFDTYIGVLPGSTLSSLRFANITSPLGQLMLATEITRRHPDARVLVVSDELTPEEVWKAEALRLVKDSKKVLVGLTLLAGNISRALALLNWFKSLGCIVVVGGPEVTTESANHYTKFFDAVVVGPAHLTIARLFEQGLTERVVNGDFICPGSMLPFGLDQMRVDYNLLLRLNQDYGGVSYLPGIGCPQWRNPCYFCGRSWRGQGLRDPARVWEELQVPLKTGIRFFYCGMDSVRRALPGLLATRPEAFRGATHKCFINAVEVNETTAKQLREFGALTTVGIESLTRVDASSKGRTTSEDNYHAISTLAEHEVPMVLTFVLGLPGETSESLKREGGKLIELVQQFGSYIAYIFLSPLLITLGSKAYYDLVHVAGPLSSPMPGEFYNPIEASKLYFHHFCSLERRTVVEHAASLKATIGQIAPHIKIDAKGLTKEEKQLMENS